jgi:isoleucyl-tRNA synthetase
MKERKSVSLPEREEDVLRFWNKKKIFEKSLARTKKGKRFVFYDGPPFATGLPHYGHILASMIKDAIPRYQTMRGRFVERRWGWDCHGLPLENIIEAELGLKTKKDIERYGIERFNKEARSRVLRYAEDWKRIIPRLARWVDMERDYKTMDWKYTETVWWIFKTLFDRRLIYEGYKSMHLCPRCETTLANFEVSQGYKEIEDIAVTVKFELVDEPGTFLLAWTTTPWTLPGNVALAINPKLSYVAFKKGGERFIAAKNSPAVAGIAAAQCESIDFENLIGRTYRPPFDYYARSASIENRENGWKIYPADFVALEEGTGIVHVAPAFGEEDRELGKKFTLPFIAHVGKDGTFSPEVKDFAGLGVKPKDRHQETDVKIAAFLKDKKLLFGDVETIKHSYPHCWRCETPLLNYAASSWFVKVEAIKQELVANNKKIYWMPEHIRDGRFGKWLEGARDWAISRSRFWGAPIPVWKCSSCGAIEVVGSLEDIHRKQGGAKNRYFVMRHGQSLANTKNLTAIRTGKYGLTFKGRRDATFSARMLAKKKIDLIISSPVLRAKETAKIVGDRLGLSPQFDERLAEINTGVFEGRNPAEYHAFFSSVLEKFTKRPPKGETLEDVRERVAQAMGDFEKTYRGKTILLVSHEYPIWMLEAGARGLSNAETAALRTGKRKKDFIRPAGVAQLHWQVLPRGEKGEIELHRPWIDRVEFPCPCGGVKERIPEVFDCWFESGAMPYGQHHYPFENRTVFDPKKRRGFPADFIAEGIDQTRGWFYSLLVLSTALFGESAFRSVVVNGTILAEDGQKMSKRLKNYPDPMEIVLEDGADALRLSMLSSSAVGGEDLNFSRKDVGEFSRKYLLIFLNMLNFASFYGIGKHGAASGTAKGRSSISKLKVLDRWALSRLHSVTAEVTAAFDHYDLARAVGTLFDFVQDLSLWYVRRSRERFRESGPDAASAGETLCAILFDLARLSAPLTPFFSEYAFRRLAPLSVGGSVHLEKWPVSNRALIDAELEKEMDQVRSIVSSALRLRAEAGIKVRQPLAALTIAAPTLEGREELLDLIKEEVNVKDIRFGPETILDTALTVDLREEGKTREVIRIIQEMRHDLGLRPRDRISLRLAAPFATERILEKRRSAIMEKTGADSFDFGGKKMFRVERNIVLEGESLWIGVAPRGGVREKRGGQSS